MTKLEPHPNCQYRFIPAGTVYSAGVIAQAGYTIHRVTFRDWPGLVNGLEWITAHLATLGQPPSALCALELRSPMPFTFEGFEAFNREYVELLEHHGLLVDGQSPIARTNVAPSGFAPAVPSIHAFSYTMPGERAPSTPGGGSRPNFVASGGCAMANPTTHAP
jgi:hypothetical protein